jgi:hypothetical protein
MQLSHMQGTLYLTTTCLVFRPNLLLNPLLFGGSLNMPLKDIATVRERKLSKLRNLYWVPAFTIELANGKWVSFQADDGSRWITIIERAAADARSRSATVA